MVGGQRISWWSRGRTWTALGITGVVAMVLAVAAVPAVLPVFRRATRSTPDRQQLLALLADYRATWRADEHAAVLAKARAQKAQLANAMHWLLTQPQHPLLPQAVTLAGELGMEPVLADLQALQSHAKVRAGAWVAADAIEPLSEAQLGELAEDADATVALAAVTIASRRAAPPWLAMLPTLRHASADVRKAGLAALPATLPAELAPALQALAQDGSGAVAAVGMQALARLPAGAVDLAFLLDQAGRGERVVAVAAATAVQARGADLPADLVAQAWRLATAPGVDPAVAARLSLGCEASGRADVDAVLAAVPALEPMSRYFAARIAVAAGRQEGIGLLLDLLGDDAAAGAALPASEREARFAARGLLAVLAHGKAASSVETFRALFADRPLSGPTTLPAPQFDY